MPALPVGVVRESIEIVFAVQRATGDLLQDATRDARMQVGRQADVLITFESDPARDRPDLTGSDRVELGCQRCFEPARAGGEKADRGQPASARSTNSSRSWPQNGTPSMR